MTLEHLDMAIAFAVVMLVVSILVTIFVQTASAAIGLRGTNLRWGVEQVLRVVHPELGDHAGSDRGPRAAASDHLGFGDDAVCLGARVARRRPLDRPAALCEGDSRAGAHRDHGCPRRRHACAAAIYPLPRPTSSAWRTSSPPPVRPIQVEAVAASACACRSSRHRRARSERPSSRSSRATTCGRGSTRRWTGCRSGSSRTCGCGRLRSRSWWRLRCISIRSVCCRSLPRIPMRARGSPARPTAIERVATRNALSSANQRRRECAGSRVSESAAPPPPLLYQDVMMRRQLMAQQIDPQSMPGFFSDRVTAAEWLRGRLSGMGKPPADVEAGGRRLRTSGRRAH